MGGINTKFYGKGTINTRQLGSQKNFLSLQKN